MLKLVSAPRYRSDLEQFAVDSFGKDDDELLLVGDDEYLDDVDEFSAYPELSEPLPNASVLVSCESGGDLEAS